MPMYMDRHYVQGATAHAIAIAHTADVAVQNTYAVRFLTYWFDELRSTAFCLVDSPDRETIRRAHQEWHGLVPNEIIDIDPAVVEAFLGRVADPTPTDPLHLAKAIDPAFRAIMFTDLKDSTLMTSKLGDAKALHLLHVSNVLTRRALQTYRGREVKHTGDGIMASFQSVPDAVLSAVSVQRAVADHNRRAPDDKITLRVGIHAGEPIEDDGDLFGTAVQLSARLCAFAGPNEIMVSETIRAMAGELNVPFRDMGLTQLKGFENGVRVFSVPWAQYVHRSVD
jgi:class 3 adenylate cyclase